MTERRRVWESVGYPGRAFPGSTSALAALCLALASTGCSGADEHPLGGPYGGTADVPNPTNGGDGAAGDSASGGDDGGSSDSGADGGGPQNDGGPAAAPTWSLIYSSYLAGGTVGDCSSSSCHSSEMSSASNGYAWLRAHGYISGASSSLVNSNSSCLSWYGGNMPPNGPTSLANAQADMDAWAKAGALNN
jgi:hypothetical protein